MLGGPMKRPLTLMLACGAILVMAIAAAGVHDDDLNGDQGDDDLCGDQGDDDLDGGAGKDLLKGGATS
jgi:Ca2+-binding RTX toxin-like protein